MSPPQLFFSKVSIIEDGCWLWTGRKRGGYGQFGTGSRAAGRSSIGSHRWAYQFCVGPIPAGLDIDHLCRNRACVNPEHMEPVTRAENVMRGEGPAARNARKLSCKNGHPFPLERRRCNVCNAQWFRDYRAKKSAARKQAA